MEFKFTFLIISSIIFLLFWLAKKIKVRSMIHKNLPGPWKLPIIGNLHQLALEGSLPHLILANLSHKYGPIMHLQLGEISTVVVSSSDLAKEIMKTHDLSFVNRPIIPASKIISYGLTDIIFSPYGDYWRQMRKICTSELLSAKRVQSFSSIREDEVEKLIQSIHLSVSQGSLDFTKIALSLVTTFISRATFGEKSKYEGELLCLLKQVEEIVNGFDVADLFPSFKPINVVTRKNAKTKNMHKKLDKILQCIINEHRWNSNHGQQGENLVDVLLRLQQSDNFHIPITNDNIKAVIWDMFGAGSDTSATVIEWAMSELMKNPRVMKKVQDEIRDTLKGNKRIYESDLHKLSYLKSVIKETMRLHPPAPLLTKECNKACNIGEYKILVKTNVIINVWAIGRDPNNWYDADEFIPERFHNNTNYDFNKVSNKSYEYIPFGGGRRMCPGISLGLANVELPLAALIYHYDWKLPNGMKPEDLDIFEAFGATPTRRKHLHLIPTPFI